MTQALRVGYNSDGDINCNNNNRPFLKKNKIGESSFLDLALDDHDIIDASSFSCEVCDQTFGLDLTTIYTRSKSYTGFKPLDNVIFPVLKTLKFKLRYIIIKNSSLTIYKSEIKYFKNNKKYKLKLNLHKIAAQRIQISHHPYILKLTHITNDKICLLSFETDENREQCIEAIQIAQKKSKICRKITDMVPMPDNVDPYELNNNFEKHLISLGLPKKKRECLMKNTKLENKWRILSGDKKSQQEYHLEGVDMVNNNNNNSHSINNINVITNNHIRDPILIKCNPLTCKKHTHQKYGKNGVIAIIKNNKNDSLLKSLPYLTPKSTTIQKKNSEEKFYSEGKYDDDNNDIVEDGKYIDPKKLNEIRLHYSSNIPKKHQRSQTEPNSSGLASISNSLIISQKNKNNKSQNDIDIPKPEIKFLIPTPKSKNTTKNPPPKIPPIVKSYSVDTDNIQSPSEDYVLAPDVIKFRYSTPRGPNKSSIKRTTLNQSSSMPFKKSSPIQNFVKKNTVKIPLKISKNLNHISDSNKSLTPGINEINSDSWEIINRVESLSDSEIPEPKVEFKINSETPTNRNNKKKKIVNDNDNDSSSDSSSDEEDLMGQTLMGFTEPISMKKSQSISIANPYKKKTLLVPNVKSSKKRNLTTEILNVNVKNKPICKCGKIHKGECSLLFSDVSEFKSNNNYYKNDNNSDNNNNNNNDNNKNKYSKSSFITNLFHLDNKNQKPQSNRYHRKRNLRSRFALAFLAPSIYE